MKYQRVLYTDKLTEKLKSELRIVAYNKRLSSKGNVFYVSFASTSDIEYADRVWKRFLNVTLKPFQPRSTNEAKRKANIIRCIYKEALPSSPSFQSSSTPFLSPPMKFTFLSDCQSSSLSFQENSLRLPNETLEERAIRILGPRLKSCSHNVSIPTAQSSNTNQCSFERRHDHNDMALNINEKNHLIDNIQSCLSAMKLVQGAADKLRQLYKTGIDYRAAMNHLIKVHSTAFYLKAAVSAQIKVALLTKLRLSWADAVDNVSAFKMDAQLEQLFMTEMASSNHILSKIDCSVSITMSSKLAYQLTKLAF